MTVCFNWLAPIDVGPAAFTASAAVFGLLAALSDSYRIAPVFGWLTHSALRRLLLFTIAANAGVALFHPLFSALALVAILAFLAWRLFPANAMRRDEEAASSAIEEEAAEDEEKLAASAIEAEAKSRPKSPT